MGNCSIKSRWNQWTYETALGVGSFAQSWPAAFRERHDQTGCTTSDAPTPGTTTTTPSMQTHRGTDSGSSGATARCLESVLHVMMPSGVSLAHFVKCLAKTLLRWCWISSWPYVKPYVNDLEPLGQNVQSLNKLNSKLATACWMHA